MEKFLGIVRDACGHNMEMSKGLRSDRKKKRSCQRLNLSRLVKEVVELLRKQSRPLASKDSFALLRSELDSRPLQDLASFKIPWIFYL
jgi:hypothetical protein